MGFLTRTFIRAEEDVNWRTIKTSDDEKFLRKIILEGELLQAKLALKRLMNISSSDQETAINFYEKHPDADKSGSELSDLVEYIEDSSSDKDALYKRILNSKTFPTSMRRMLCYWNLPHIQKACRDYLMTSKDRGERYDAPLAVYIDNKLDRGLGVYPNGDEEKYAEEDILSDDQEFLKHCLSNTTNSYILPNLAHRLPSDFVADNIAKRDDLDELSRLDIYRAMRIDEYSLKKIIQTETDPKVLKKIFHKIQDKIIPDDVLIKTAEKLPPADVDSHDYREHLLTLVQDREKLMPIAKNDKSTQLRYLAYEQMKSKDGWKQATEDPSPYIRFKAIENSRSNPEIALKVFKTESRDRIKQEAVLWISPDDFTVDMIPYFKKGNETTDFPNEVALDLKVKGYKIADNAEDKKYFASMLPKRLLDPEDRTIEKLSFDEEDKRRTERVDHEVSSPQHQLFRLLLTYARPPSDKQKSAAALSKFWARTYDKYRRLS